MSMRMVSPFSVVRASIRCGTFLALAVIGSRFVSGQGPRAVAAVDPETAKLLLIDRLLPNFGASPGWRSTVFVRLLPSFHPEESISIRINEANSEIVYSVLGIRARAELDARFDRTGNLEVDEVAKSCPVTTKRIEISRAEAVKWLDSMSAAFDISHVRLKSRIRGAVTPKAPRSIQLDGTEYEIGFQDFSGLTFTRELGPELEPVGGPQRQPSGLIAWALSLREAVKRRR